MRETLTFTKRLKTSRQFTAKPWNWLAFRFAPRSLPEREKTKIRKPNFGLGGGGLRKTKLRKPCNIKIYSTWHWKFNTTRFSVWVGQNVIWNLTTFSSLPSKTENPATLNKTVPLCGSVLESWFTLTPTPSNNTSKLYGFEQKVQLRNCKCYCVST